ncbi:hypothetical protein M9H77_05893 [Catharanthus roseus]|uniref:Uncharacterized protein n=1 Tax=Catharanthus roseus TaxID=4058 RepID=A0ACC0BQS2_CATRO|nr:hypothetical protein M9H77_05893 [Catharanthus roseus]
MKPSLLLFSILILFYFSSASKVPHSVLDTARNTLRTSLYYYIFPADTISPDRGGGLAVGGIGNELCPLTVIQRKIYLEDGLPLQFFPFNHKRGVVRLSTDLNIQFAFPDSCNQTMVWKLEDYDISTGKYFVGVNGTAGKPGQKSLANWFKIEPFGRDYKLRYCPSVCKFCKVICKGVGLVIDQNGKRRLALSDVPYKIVFRQA